MKIEGIHKCNSAFKDCDNNYEWMVIVPQKIGSRNIQAETINKPLGRIVETTDELYIIETICPKCHQDNIIEYKRNK